MDVSKLAARLEAHELVEDKEKLTTLYSALYHNPYTTLGEIRCLFDNASADDLKKLFAAVLTSEDDSFEDEDSYVFGAKFDTSVLIDSNWNAVSSWYYWQKIKPSKKNFF